MRNEVNEKAKKVYKRKLFTKILKVVFLLLLLVITVLYFILYAIYNGDNFTISVDHQMSNKRNIYLSVDGKDDNLKKELSTDTYDYMDNISIKWINKDVDTEADGAHNGNNYLAYSFYLMNNGEKEINYWYEIDIDDTIRNVDTAIRIMIYQNGIPTVYAKLNADTGKAEEGTVAFYSDAIAVLEERYNFSPGDKDHYTVVVWIEGDDPDCKNDLIGGGIKMHMDFREESLNDSNK